MMLAQVAWPLVDRSILRRVPWLDWYVTAGGVYGVAIAILGTVLLTWGLWNLRTRSRRWVLLHLSLCWVPVVVSCVCCGAALRASFAPAMSATTILNAFVCGVAGPLAAMLPAFLAMAQLWRLEADE